MQCYVQSLSDCVIWKPPEPEETGTEEEPRIREYAEATKVFLQRSPDNTDMWDAARHLIPHGKENDFLIVYLPKGTGQPRMYADAFYGEYIASWSRDDDHDWALSDYTHP